jgi:beta propeller repeat protein
VIEGVEIFIEHNKYSIKENKRRSKLSKIVLFLGLIMILSIIISGAVSASTPKNGVPVCTNKYQQSHPDIYQDKIVWTDVMNTKDYKSYILVKDLKTGKTTMCDPVPQLMSQLADQKQVRKALGYQGSPTGGDAKVYGNTIIWEGSYDEDMGDDASDYGIGEDFQDNCQDIYMWNIPNKKFSILPRYGPGKYNYHKMWPAISGNRIVWEDNRNGDWEIYMYDIASKHETRITYNSKNQGNVAIYGNIVAWIDYRNKGSTTNNDVYMYNIANHITSRVTLKSGFYDYIKINANNIFYYNSGKIVKYSTLTKKTVTVLNSACDYAVTNNKIVWTDFRNANDDIYMKDLTTGKETPVCTAPGTQCHPAIYGSKIVWEDWRNGNADIYMKDVSIVYDNIAPKVSTTTPTNLKTGISRTSAINIKFSENIKTSTYFNNMNIKNLATGKYLTLARTISGNTLIIHTSTRNANTWYQVTIPKAAIKDYAGNNLAANYTFRFKTGV